MALGAWLQSFREMHDRAKGEALAGRDLDDYLAARDELARALMAAQRVALPAGLRPRRALRVARALQVDVDLGDKAMRAATVDVSAAGFAALLPSAPRVGDEARVTIRVPGGEPLRASARVVEAKATPGSARVAFAFVAMGDAEHERLERFVFDAVLAQLQ